MGSRRRRGSLFVLCLVPPFPAFLAPRASHADGCPCLCLRHPHPQHALARIPQAAANAMMAVTQTMLLLACLVACAGTVALPATHTRAHTHHVLTCALSRSEESEGRHFVRGTTRNALALAPGACSACWCRARVRGQGGFGRRLTRTHPLAHLRGVLCCPAVGLVQAPKIRLSTAATAAAATAAAATAAAATAAAAEASRGK